MATAPIKSQPLHNFSLPHLRWAHKNHHQQHQPPPPPPPHSTHHRFRRRDSPEFDPENDDAKPPSSRAPRKPTPFSSFTTCSSASLQDKKTEQKKDDVVEEGEKPWNLRPRKLVSLPTGNESVLLKSSSSRARGMAVVGEVGGGVVGPGFSGTTERQQRKVVEEKRKLWISLSREEIEEDVYSLTGSRPSRRPKKRLRNVQKQLDNVFPGLYLVGMSIDSFRGHDSLR